MTAGKLAIYIHGFEVPSDHQFFIIISYKEDNKMGIKELGRKD